MIPVCAVLEAISVVAVLTFVDQLTGVNQAGEYALVSNLCRSISSPSTSVATMELSHK